MRVISLSIPAALLMLAATAFAQDAAQLAPAAPAQELSEEDRNAAPFPAGPNAALVKKVCVDCHDASRVLDLRYTRSEAEGFYKNMVSEDLTTDQAKKIIDYLVTHLGV